MATSNRCCELLSGIKSTEVLHANRKKAKRSLVDCEAELKFMHQLREKEPRRQDLNTAIACKEAKIAMKQRKLARVKKELSQTDTISIAEELGKMINELEVHSVERSNNERKMAELEGEKRYLLLLISS